MIKPSHLALCSFSLVNSQLLLANDIQTDFLSLSLTELRKAKVVTAASGYEQDIEKAPASVTVILRDEWESMGASTLYEALTTVKGLHISIDTRVNEVPTIIMRGLGDKGTQVKVLIDGESFDDRTRARVKQFSRLSLSSFKRIEIIRGPGSVVYGADAFAGIINLVSEEPGSQSNNHVALKAGKFNYKDFSLAYGSQFDDLKWYLSLQKEKSDLTERLIGADAQTGLDLAPFSQLTPPASNAPGYLQDWFDVKSINTKLAYKALSINLFHWQANAGIQLGITDRLDDVDNPVSASNNSHTHLKVAYQLDNLSENIPGALVLSAVYEEAEEDNDFMIFPAGAVVLVGDDGNLFTQGSYPAILTDNGLVTHTGLNTKVYSYKINHIFRANPTHGIRWELGYETMELTSEFIRMFGPGVTDSNTLPRPDDGAPLILGKIGSGVDLNDSPLNQFILPAKRNFWFLSVQDEWTPTKDWNVSFGIRYDKYSDFGSTTNPRIGVNWQYSPSLKLKAFTGTAFRAPAFGELYSRNNTVIDGNEDLKPETIETLEFGATYDLTLVADLLVSATVFKFKTDDIIQELPNSQTGKLLTSNGNGEEGKGVEFELLWKPYNSITVKFNFSKLEVKDPITKLDKINTADTLANLNINWVISPTINWNIGIKRVSGRDRALNDPRGPIDNYMSFNTRFAWNYNDSVEVAVLGRNITDNYISEPGPLFLERDYPMGAEQFSMELRYRF